MNAPEPAIETSTLERISEWGGKELLEQLVEMFVSTTPERLAQIRRGAAGGEIEPAHRAAHSLRSSAHNLGATTLSKMAEEAEATLEAGGTYGLSELVERMDQEFARARLVLVGAAPEVEVAVERPRVAVVEDNPDNRLLVRALLGDLYEISEYENGPEALAGITSDPPHVVLLDISLPEMDGTEVLAQIRGDVRLRELPVIALTAHAMAGDREKYLALGFNDYVTKPIVDENILIEAIESWLKGRS